MSTPSDSPENSSRAPEIRPALPADAWEMYRGMLPSKVASLDADSILYHDGPHALAALCLHDHPAGFGWEDVERIRRVADTDHSWDEGEWAETRARLTNLADRISALLPPKEE